MEKKISITTLDKVSLGLLVAGGVLTLGLTVFMIVQFVEYKLMVSANKKAAAEETEKPV